MRHVASRLEQRLNQSSTLGICKLAPHLHMNIFHELEESSNFVIKLKLKFDERGSCALPGCV